MGGKHKAPANHSHFTPREDVFRAMLPASQFQNRNDSLSALAIMRANAGRHPDLPLRHRGHHCARRRAGSVAQARRRQLQLGAGNAAIPRNRESRWKSARWLVTLRTGCVMSEVSDTAKCPCAETSNIAATAFVTRRQRTIIRHKSTFSGNTVTPNCLSAVFSAEHVR